MRVTQRQMPEMHSKRCVCWYASTIAARSGVPHGYSGTTANGEPYTSADSVSFPNGASARLSLPGRTCVQIAPEMVLPSALPML